MGRLSGQLLKQDEIGRFGTGRQSLGKSCSFGTCSGSFGCCLQSLTESARPNEGFAFGVTWLEMGVSLA